MSVQRLRKNHSQRLNIVKNKLDLVDHHIRKSQNLPATLFMHPQLIQYLIKDKQSNQRQITNQLSLNQTRSVLFNQTSIATFYFDYLPLQPDKRYCLKVQPKNTELTVKMSVDGKKQKKFKIKKTQGIQVGQKNWKRVQFTFISSRIQKLSIAKLQMTTITIQFAVKVRGVPSQRKVAEEQIKQYLKNNLNQVSMQMILEKRRRKSLSSRRISRQYTSPTVRNNNNFDECENSTMFKTLSEFRPQRSARHSLQPNLLTMRVHSAQIKKDLFLFQVQKGKLMKHLQKMLPQKAERISKQQKIYSQNKVIQLRKTATLCIMGAFIEKIQSIALNIYKHKIMKIHADILCKRFIKNLMSSNKLRAGIKVKNKMSIDINLSVISCILYTESRNKAITRAYQSINTECFKLDVEQISNLSEKYYINCQKIQKIFKGISRSYRHRFQILVKQKGYTFRDEKDFNKCYAKYRKQCYRNAKHLRFNFTKYHNLLDQYMMTMKVKQHSKQQKEY